MWKNGAKRARSVQLKKIFPIKENFLQIYNVGAPFEKVQLDVLGPLPITSAENICLSLFY